MTINVASIPLEIENLIFTYRIRTTPAIENINLSINPGELMLVAVAVAAQLGLLPSKKD